jgi:hypothetical protein
MWSSNGSHDGTSARLFEASRELGNAMREHGVGMARRAGTGIDYARDLAEDTLARGRYAARSTRELVVARPIEALLIVGLASFAFGWLLRHMQKDADAELRAPSRARTKGPARARKS